MRGGGSWRRGRFWVWIRDPGESGCRRRSCGPVSNGKEAGEEDLRGPWSVQGCSETEDLEEKYLVGVLLVMKRASVWFPLFREVGF